MSLNPALKEAEAGGSLSFRPDCFTEQVPVSQGYKTKLSLKTKQNPAHTKYLNSKYYLKMFDFWPFRAKAC